MDDLMYRNEFISHSMAQHIEDKAREERLAKLEADVSDLKRLCTAIAAYTGIAISDGAMAELLKWVRDIAGKD